MNNQDLHHKQIKPETKKRILFGALSGFIAGTIAALVSSFINTWVFTDLPLYLHWPSIFYAWVLWAILGGMLAGLSAFSAEGWASVLISAVGMSFTILLLNIMQSSEGSLLKTVSLFGLLFPVAAMMSPLAFIFFWLARRFLGIVFAAGWARIKVILVNTIVILVIGAIPGAYARMDERTEQAVRIIHGMLQDAANASSSETLNKAFAKTEGFADHRSQPYTLSQSPSVYSTVGVDVIAHYEDDYTVICTVVMYPGSDPSIYPCKGQMP